MGNKGVQRRRRNALAANSANLHKAQFGKATKFDKLPDAPKAGAFVQPVSKSTRKVQQLMAVIASQSGQQISAGAVDDGRVPDANAGMEYHTATGEDGAAEPQQRSQGTGGEVAGGAPAKISMTKLKRKQHLADKKGEKRKKFQEKQKRGKQSDVQGDATHDFKSNAFKLEHVPFGEVADAPPHVSLKRRHHVDDTGVASRHSLALQKHLQAGHAKLLKGAQGADEARKAVMGAYRASKSKQPDHGDCRVASMDSLKALVRSQALSQ